MHPSPPPLISLNLTQPRHLRSQLQPIPLQQHREPRPYHQAGLLVPHALPHHGLHVPLAHPREEQVPRQVAEEVGVVPPQDGTVVLAHGAEARDDVRYQVGRGVERRDEDAQLHHADEVLLIDGEGGRQVRARRGRDLGEVEGVVAVWAVGQHRVEALELLVDFGGEGGVCCGGGGWAVDLELDPEGAPVVGPGGWVGHEGGGRGEVDVLRKVYREGCHVESVVLSVRQDSSNVLCKSIDLVPGSCTE